MPSSRWGLDPLPAGSQAASVPADLKALADSMDARTVHVALDAADRDARFGDTPVGSIVTAPAPAFVWLKTGTGSGAWKTIYSDSGWISTGFTAASGFTANVSRGRIIGSICYIQAGVNRSGGDLNVDNKGNVADTALMTLPAQFRPSGSIFETTRTSLSGGEVQIGSDGVVTLTSAHSDSVIQTGHNLSWSSSYPID